MHKQSPEKDNQRRQIIYSVIYLVVWGLVLIGVNLWIGWPNRPQKVPYSQFLTALDAGAVDSVTIGEQSIIWQVAADEEAGETAVFKTDRVPGINDPDLIQQLRVAGVEFSGHPPNTFWSTILSWVVPILLLALVWRYFLGRLPGATQALNLGRSRAKIWDESGEKITFNDVAGVDEAVAELREVVDYLKIPEKYEEIGAQIPKGILLVGPPGTGKTLLAKATATEAGVPFFSISGADFVEMFAGVGAARVRDLFKQAREKAPCIVFIDEIDTIGRSRAGSRSPISNEEREQTLNQLLVEMDGFDSATGVILMAATNRPDVLDPALLRPGRFDRQITVDKPDLNGREAILKIHTRDVTLATNVDLRVIAARTPGFAGAELANLVNEAALLSVRQGRKAVTMTDFDEAIDRVMAGLERKSRVLNDKEREIVAHHEMGHALAGLLLSHADPVHKVSIIPRGTAALGVTIQVPLEDRYLLSEDELRDRMTVMLAGRAAEEVIYGKVSTGPADDLQRVTQIARRMVTQFGMNRELGPVALEAVNQGYLDGEGFTQKQYGEKTADCIDAEVQRLVSEMYQRARQLMREQEPILREAAQRLLQEEVMDGDALRQFLEERRVALPAANV